MPNIQVLCSWKHYNKNEGKMKKLLFLILALLISAKAYPAAPDVRISDGDGTSVDVLDVNDDGTLSDEWSYSFINATSAATTLKTGAGKLRLVSINDESASGAMLIFMDAVAFDASAQIASIDLADNAAPTTLHYDVKFNTGLTYRASGGVIANVTVAYN